MQLKTQARLASAAIGLLFGLFSLQPHGQSQPDPKEMLALIADFAERMCGSVPLKGESSSIELNGQAKLELDKLIKKFAAAGVSGAIKYQSSEYAGLLQRDLAAAFNKQQDCRINVFQDLSNKLLPSPRSNALPPFSRTTKVPCSARWTDCVGYENLTGMWRGKFARGPLVSVIVQQQSSNEVHASLEIEDRNCRMDLRLVRVHEMFTTSEFFFHPLEENKNCPTTQSLVLVPLTTTGTLRLNRPDGVIVSTPVGKS